MNEFMDLAIQWAGKYPKLNAVLGLIGFLRLALKPFCVMVLTPLMQRAIVWVKSTKETEDDLWLDKLLHCRLYRIVAFLLDWLASVKLPLEVPKDTPAG